MTANIPYMACLHFLRTFISIRWIHCLARHWIQFFFLKRKRKSENKYKSLSRESSNFVYFFWPFFKNSVQCMKCSWLFKHRWSFFVWLSCKLCVYCMTYQPVIHVLLFMKHSRREKLKRFFPLMSHNLHAINHYSNCHNDEIIHWILSICRKAIYYRRAAKKWLRKLFPFNSEYMCVDA